MKNAIILDANDVKEIIAKHYGVKTEDVIKSQYSYTVAIEDAKSTGTGSVSDDSCTKN